MRPSELDVIPDRFTFRVEQWDDCDLRIEDVLCAATNLRAARAAYEAAVKERPRHIVKLRQRRC